MNNEKWKREGGGAVKRFFVIFFEATPQLTISVSARSVQIRILRSGRNLAYLDSFSESSVKKSLPRGWIGYGKVVW